MRSHINLGVAGAGGRGGSMLYDGRIEGIRIHAVCDADADRLDRAADKFGASHKYLHYEQLLDCPDLGAILLGTPMHLHADQAIAALRRNIHVLSEVTAGVTIDQCKSLVQAANESSATYMLAENYPFMRSNMIPCPDRPTKFTHVSACAFARSPKVTFTQSTSTNSLPPSPLWLLPAKRSIGRAGFAPAGVRRLFTAY